MKKEIILLFLWLILIFSFISAASISKDLHLNIQTTNASGSVVTGTFAFVFNISNNSDCAAANIVYNNSTTLTTDSRGILSYYLPNVSLDYDQQYWLCYYRDGTLINNSKIARTPYTFRARNITLSGVEVDSNLNLGNYNLTIGGGWLNNGVSIIDGGIYAQVGYFYNITSLNVTKQNLTVIENFIVEGNVTANYFLGDGSFLTGITGSSTSWNRSGTNVFLHYTGDKVGIGTTSPSRKFVVDSGGDTIAGWFKGPSSGIELYIGAAESSGDILSIRVDADNDYGNLRMWGDTEANGLTIKKGGNVGIGTTTPTHKLNVVGNTNITGNITLGQKITFVLGEIIDNLVDGWIRITGNLNVTESVQIGGGLNVTGDLNVTGKYYGDGSELTGVSGSGSIASYDTGWIANSVWTNQHLGSAVGGNVVHDLNAPLRNLNVKVFISTDGTDANSFEVGYDAIEGVNDRRGIRIEQVDNNNLIVQTGAEGIFTFTTAGGRFHIDDEAYYYRIVVYEMTTVYSGTALDYYETNWVSNSDWTDQHLGTVAGGNVSHDLNAPLNDLIVQVLFSSDGTDANSWEIIDTDTVPGAGRGVGVFAVDNDNIIVQTADGGVRYVQAGGSISELVSNAYYYKIKVYKMTAMPVVAAKTIDKYDTGWVANSDWTNQHLGTTAGGNVTHNLATPLRNLAVKVFVSTDGTDANSFEMPTMMFDTAAQYYRGLTYYHIDNNNIKIQTGTKGLGFLRDSDGLQTPLSNEAYYYRIIVYKMSTVYSGTALDYYETPWINREDWNNVHMGSDTTKDADSDVTHNLNAPLRDLIVKVFISNDSTDDNSLEIPYGDTTWGLSNYDRMYGVSIWQVDSNNIIVQTAINGFSLPKADGTWFAIDAENWYYKIKVYKMTAMPVVADEFIDRNGTDTYVKNTGDNFGIGTTTPTQKLHVEGDLNVTGAIYGDGSGLTGIVGGRWNVSGTNFYPENLSYNVGIGTTTPSHKLNVVGNVNITGNLTLGQKITFALGEIIDNIVDGWIRITGNLNVTGNVTADYFSGDGSLLTNVTGSIASYDTGWISNSDWTNQHLGTAAGGNVVHNLATPLRNLVVKVFVSNDSTDANSFEILDFTRVLDIGSSENLKTGITIYAVDNNNLIIQTGQDGFYYVASDGDTLIMDTDAFYYRIIVYEMTTVYSGTALDYYETPWINRSDFSGVHMGSDTTLNVDSNLNHALSAPLRDLMVQVFLSTDGTDANSFEVYRQGLNEGGASIIGITIYEIDSNNIKIQTGSSGLGRYILDDSTSELIDSEEWYYKIKVYKMTAVPRTQETIYQWQKIEDPPTGYIAEKTSGWTADQFTPGGLEVDFSAVVPVGTKAVRVVIYQATPSAVWYRKSGDASISNTPGASSELSHYLMSNAEYAGQFVIWLSSDYKAQFAVWLITQDLHITYPIEVYAPMGSI